MTILIKKVETICKNFWITTRKHFSQLIILTIYAYIIRVDTAMIWNIISGSYLTKKWDKLSRVRCAVKIHSSMWCNNTPELRCKPSIAPQLKNIHVKRKQSDCMKQGYSVNKSHQIIITFIAFIFNAWNISNVPIKK